MQLNWSLVRGFTVDVSVRVDGSGSSQESTRKYRYGLLKRVTLKHINNSIFMTLVLRSEVKSQGILRNVLGKEWG